MMHCTNWEERIALHVGGDLAAADAANVERHLAECAACQVFWSGMKESLEILDGVHAEALGPGCYTAVRGRVLDELASRNAWWRRGWFVRLTPVGLAAAVVVMVLASWPGRLVETVPLRMAVVIPPPPAQKEDLVGQAVSPAKSRQKAAGQAKGLPHLAHVAGHMARRQVATAVQVEKPPRQPLLVRLITDDPNVVIYWIAD